jgi:hypothetical protein
MEKLHNEELHYLYSSPNIIRMFKSRRKKWVRNVARIRGRESGIGPWRESQKESDH